MILYFNPDKVPRSTTREQWAEMHRWLRTTERRLKEHMDRRKNISSSYSAPRELASKWADEVIDPPLLLGPHT